MMQLLRLCAPVACFMLAATAAQACESRSRDSRLYPPDTPDALLFTGDLGQRRGPASTCAAARSRCASTTHLPPDPHRRRPAATGEHPRRGWAGRRSSATASVFNGPPPEILIAANPGEEIDKAFDRAVLAEGVEPACYRSVRAFRDKLPWARAVAAKAGIETAELVGRTKG
jgi:hypothetical protein